MGNEIGRGWMIKVLESWAEDDELYPQKKGSH